MSVMRTCTDCGYHREYATDALAAAHHPRHSCRRHRERTDAAQRRADRANGAATRDCTHPGLPHRHGQRVAYVKDICRCTACTAANTAASRIAARAQPFGRWAPFVDATAARDHIELLRAHHLGYEQISRLAGTSFTHIREIAGAVARSGNRPPIKRIRRDLADRILAITPDPTNRSPRSQVNATGTRRRLQALVAIGWPVDRLAACLGRTPTNLQRTMTGTTVTARTAQIIDDLYNDLWDKQPPHTIRDECDAMEAAKRAAAEQGWLPPLAWDDIDTDPTPDSNALARRPGDDDIDEVAIERALAGDGIRLADLTPAEQTEAVCRLTQQGKSIRDIADHLATTKRTVSRRRHAARRAA